MVWGDSVDGDAQAILADAERSANLPSRLDEAKDFLCGVLIGSGRVPSTKILELATAAGHSTSTINRAKAELRVRAEKDGNGGWFWRL